MLGTLTLGATAALGFFHMPFWSILPLVLVNNFIGIHTPPQRLLRLREMGVSYWSFFVKNLPLIAALTSAVYGLGYAIGWLLL